MGRRKTGQPLWRTVIIQLSSGQAMMFFAILGKCIWACLLDAQLYLDFGHVRLASSGIWE